MRLIPDRRLRRPALRNRAGVTMIELLIALFLTVFVAMAAGVIFTTSQRSYRQGEGKLGMQRNATQAIEQIARDVRAARRVNPVSATEIRCFDIAGAETVRYTTGASGGTTKALRSGAPLVDETCTLLTFAANADTSVIAVQLELEDAAQNRVRVDTKVFVRNRNYSAF